MIGNIAFILREGAKSLVGTAMIWPVNEYLLNKIFSTAWKFILG